MALVTSCRTDTVTVKGTIADGEIFPAGWLVYLCDGKTVLDSSAVVNGRFELKAPANLQKGYGIVADFRNRPSDYRDWRMGVLAEKGIVKITFASKRNDCAIKEGPLNMEYDDVEDRINAIFIETQQKASLLADADEEERMALYNDVIGRLKSICLPVIEKNNDNLIGLSVLDHIIYYLSLEEIDSILCQCGSFIIDNEDIVEERDFKVAEKETAEGNPFVDFSGKTPEGNDIKLSDYVGKGRWVLADFWASWCGPCKRELPNIKRTHKSLSGDKFTVLGIAVWDGDNTESLECMKENEMTWPQIFVGEDETPTKAYGISSIPTLILFAPDGSIYKRDGLRGEKMMETIRNIIYQ